MSDTSILILDLLVKIILGPFLLVVIWWYLKKIFQGMLKALDLIIEVIIRLGWARAEDRAALMVVIPLTLLMVGALIFLYGVS